MLKIVSTPAQVTSNIKRFQTELEKSPGLQARLPYARAWYATRNDDGSWSFGPSKFVGYDNIDAETYLETAQDADGRRTEAQLQMLFKPVDPSDPLYAELNSGLVGFLAKYGKAPSTMMRINISRGLRRIFSARPSADDAHSALVRVIVEAVRTLPTEHFQELREQLEGMAS